MIPTIDVDPSGCTRCGACIETCPVSVLAPDREGRPEPRPDQASRCIGCGHCEAVCPTGALRNAGIAPARAIRGEALSEVTPGNLAEYFRSRRSVRSFLPRPVDRETLEAILEVVAHSPTGVNLQRNRWILVVDPAVVRRLAEATVEWMRSMVAAGAGIAANLGFERLVAEFDGGRDVVCRSAPCLAIGYTSASHGGGAIDSLVATAHMELLLPAHGLGGCWAGYLMIALGASQEIRDIVGIDETHAVRSALMIGTPRRRFRGIPSRKAPDAIWI